MFSRRSAMAWATANINSPVASAGKITPNTAIRAIEAFQASLSAIRSMAPQCTRHAAWIASTASSVSASAAGLSGRWRSTRANRSVTPPG